MNKMLSGSCAACSAAIIILVLSQTSTAAPVETREDAWKFLNSYGYVPPVQEGAALQDEETAFKNALLAMQHMAGINQTGEMDEKTKELMGTPRCSVKDDVGHNNEARRRKKRYAIEGSKWKNTDITYGFTSYTNQLTQTAQRSILQSALQKWADQSALTFRETSASNNDIQIQFSKGNHGDCCPFDGPLGVLAHAFFPSSGGDAHFDDAETWTQNTNSGTNLLQVSTHEFGHSLGLGHSNVPSAIMYAYYTGYNPNPQLTDDDISGIRYIYGGPASGGSGSATNKPPTTAKAAAGAPTTRPASTTRAPPTTRYVPVNQPSICSRPKVDAIVAVDGVTYAFSDSNYYILNDNGIAPGYPKTIVSNWPQISGPIDTALYYPPETSRDIYGRTVITKKGLLFLYQGSRYWRYSNVNQLDAGYPRDIATGFPGIPNNIDASFQWSGNGRYYFIKGSNYYRYNPTFGTDAGYPKPLSSWIGLPNNITAAFQYVNGATYFFAGTQYYRFDDINFRVASSNPPYPRGNGAWWFGCSSSLVSGDLKEEDTNDKNKMQEMENANIPNDNSSSQLSFSSFTFLVASLIVVQLTVRYL